MPCASKRAMIDPRVDIEFGQPLVDVLAQRSRQCSSSSVRFQSRTFWPNPSSPTSRMVSMTCACGLGMPSAPMSQCTLRSAIMPRSTNSRSNEVARQLDALRLRSARAESRTRSRGRAARPCASRPPRPRSTAARDRASCSGAPSGSITSEWTTPALFGEVVVRDRAARRAAARPSDRRPTPARSSRWRGEMTLAREMVDRHDGNPSTLRSARRHDV